MAQKLVQLGSVNFAASYYSTGPYSVCSCIDSTCNCKKKWCKYILLTTTAAVQAVLESGSGRDINRHKYSEEEAQEALKQPVVKALLDLCKFRNTHQAFMGQVRMPFPPPSPPYRPVSTFSQEEGPFSVPSSSVWLFWLSLSYTQHLYWTAVCKHWFLSVWLW